MLVAFGLKDTQSGKVSTMIIAAMGKGRLTVAVSDGRVLDRDSVRLEDIPAIGVLLKAEGMTDGADPNVGKHNVTRICNDVCPERRIVQAEIGN